MTDAHSENELRHSRSKLVTMTLWIGGLFVFLAAANIIDGWSKRRELATRPPVQYVDSRGNPISKEKAEAWLEQRRKAHDALEDAQRASRLAPTHHPDGSGIDTGMLGSRHVSGDLNCQYYINGNDDVELSVRSSVTNRYVSSMATRCPGDVTLVYPDGTSRQW